MLKGWFLKILSFVPIFILLPLPAFAAGLVPIVPTQCNGPDCTICHFAQLAQNLLNDGIFIAVVLTAILFAWAGFMHLTAGGNQGKISKANQVFTSVAVGLIIILCSWLIVDTLLKVMTGNNQTLGRPWNQVCEK